LLKEKSKRIVVDTSVACTSSDTTECPDPQQCREILATILEVCHHVVMTPEIWDEWKKHLSKYSKKWYRSMIAKKKRYEPEMEKNSGIQTKIDSISNQPDREIMLKDLRLIEAALAADHIVISLDKEARKAFIKHAVKISEFKNIIWVNPSIPDERVVEWLQQGAESEKKRMLGYLITSSKKA